MLKRKSLTALAGSLFLAGAVSAYAAGNTDKNNQIQIQNASTPSSGLTSSQLSSPFADQIQQMHEMQEQMNNSIRNTLNDPFFSQAAFNSPNFKVPRMQTSNYPQMKYYVKDNDYVVEFIVPGMDKKDIKIELNNNVLTVSGKAEQSEKSTDKDSQSSYSCTNEFMQSIRVPDDADTAKISSKYNNGVLTITVPKNAQKASAPQVIPIN